MKSCLKLKAWISPDHFSLKKVLKNWSFLFRYFLRHRKHRVGGIKHQFGTFSSYTNTFSSNTFAGIESISSRLALSVLILFVWIESIELIGTFCFDTFFWVESIELIESISWYFLFWYFFGNRKYRVDSVGGGSALVTNDQPSYFQPTREMAHSIAVERWNNSKSKGTLKGTL